MSMKARPLFDPQIVGPAIAESFKKLNPLHMWKNPVMFVTEVGAAVTTAAASPQDTAAAAHRRRIVQLLEE